MCFLSQTGYFCMTHSVLVFRLIYRTTEKCTLAKSVRIMHYSLHVYRCMLLTWTSSWKPLRLFHLPVFIVIHSTKKDHTFELDRMCINPGTNYSPRVEYYINNLLLKLSRQQYHGNTSAIPWQYIISNTMAIHQQYHGNTSAIPWQYIINNTMAIHQQYHGNTSAIPWQYVISNTMAIHHQQYHGNTSSAIPWQPIISNTMATHHQQYHGNT